MGLEVEVERLLGTYSCRPIGKNMVFIVCLARVTGGELRLSEELADARWYPLDALPDWPPEWPVARAFADLRRLENEEITENTEATEGHEEMRVSRRSSIA